MNSDKMPNSGDPAPSWYADPPPADYEPSKLPPKRKGKFLMVSDEMFILFCDNGDMVWLYPAKIVRFENVSQPNSP